MFRVLGRNRKAGENEPAGGKFILLHLFFTL